MNCLSSFIRAAVVAASCIGGIAAAETAAPLKVSVMGDSYSAWKPADLPGHYAQSCAGNSGGYGFGYLDVTDYHQTYWMQFIDHIGGVLEVNNSWEASRLSNSSSYRTPFIHQDRIDDIGDPDVLLICGGMNDAWGTGGAAAQLGEFKYSDWTADDLTKFRPALAYLIDHQKNAHPGMAIIIVINSYDDASSGSGVPGLTYEWCSSMATIAEHYGVLYVQCHDIQKESWHPTKAGFTAMASQIAEVWDAEYVSDLPSTFEEADPSVQVIETSESLVYVFTNATRTIRMETDADMTLMRALFVGGGGEGGHIIGGGGGGGEVVAMNDCTAIPAGSRLKIKVGAGGSTAGKPADGTYGMSKARWHYQNGANGGASSFSFGDTIHTAAGGGGGASWNSNYGSAGANGGGGSGYTSDMKTGRGGAGASGHDGGDVVKGSGEYDYFAGGGGGAGAPGEDGGTVGTFSGRGGEGVTNSITGTAVVYGSGGGGGGGNGAKAAVGGTNAGTGGTGNGGNPRSPLGQPGFPGLDGTGAGGGGGGFELFHLDGDYPSYTGGNGGSGTIILEFSKISRPCLGVSVSKNPEESATISFRLTSAGADATQADIYVAYGEPGQLGAYALAGTLQAGESGSFVIDGLELDTEYSYSVKAVNNADPSVELIVDGTFATVPPFWEVPIAELDPSVRMIKTDEGIAYVFTNASQSVAFGFESDMTIVRALLVGGGGEGGHIIGGGGGGGAVVELTDALEIPAKTMVTVTVGAGGSTPGKPASGTYMMNQARWHYENGVNGGASSFSFDGVSYSAEGGGGGASWNSNYGSEGANGGGGSGYTADSKTGCGGKPEAGYNGGDVVKGPNVYDYFAGGGAGAGADGENGGTIGSYSGRGGEGVAVEIAGTNIVYGSGGGGGGGNGAIAAVGGTNGGAGGTGNGGNPRSPLGQPGFPGLDGTGAGGGGGGFELYFVNGDYPCYTGGNGGCGTVILVFAQKDQLGMNVRVADDPAESATISFRLTSAGDKATQADIYVAYGEPGRLGAYALADTLQAGESGSFVISGLKRGTEYAYSVKAVNAAEPSAELVVDGTFTTRAPFVEIPIEELDPTVRKIRTPEGIAYVFTNTSETVSFGFGRKMTLLRALVVGGGGEGGHIIAGGGGGGQVLELDGGQVIPAETEIKVAVGAGGSTQDKPGHYDMTVWKGHESCGTQGGSSTLVIGSSSYTAFGGGGGWSWDSTSGGAGANGGGGAGEKSYIQNKRGTGAEGGHDGGIGGVKLADQYDYAAGGGAGAGEDGEDGGTIGQYSGRGGEGVTNSITGSAVVYGSGGGGGGGNGILPAVGGTNGGAGGTGNLDGDPYDLVGRVGYPGIDGTGSGGGGGGFKMDGLHCYSGGNGGCGTVILLFAPVSRSTIFMLY